MKPISEPSEKIEVDSISEAYPDIILKGKSIYAFGDSVVYGHTAPEKSYTRIIADDYGMKLTMCAKNGASVMTIDSSDKEAEGEETAGNYIISQVKTAPDEKPDVILFNGGTNDAYTGVTTHPDLFEHIGVIQGPNASEFDTTTFCGGFESIVYNMRQKWGDTPIVYVTVHKSGGRDWDAQCKVRELALEICERWGVSVADVFNDSELDTRDEEQMKQYIMGGAGSHPNETACRRFYIPIVKGALKKAVTENK